MSEAPLAVAGYAGRHSRIERLYLWVQSLEECERRIIFLLFDTMLRYWLGLGASLAFLLWPHAFTFTAEAHEIERVDTPGLYQNRGDPAIHLDPHYDPNSTMWWGDIPESDDDPPFGIVGLGAGEGPAAGRGPVAKVRVQESEWRQVGGAISAMLRRGLRDLYDVWDRLGVSLRVPFRGDRWRHRSGKSFLPAPEGRRARLRENGAGRQGGEKESSERWTGDIKNFMADRKLGRVEVSGSQLPLQVTTLEADIQKQSLGVVELGDLVCPHSECPRFQGCPQNFSTRFRACDNTIFSQTVTDLAKDPENCPDNREDKRVWNNVIHNPLCTHVGDSTPHSPYMARISVLDNVYVSWSGQTFDSEKLFNQDGCSSSSDVSPHPLVVDGDDINMYSYPFPCSTRITLKLLKK